MKRFMQAVAVVAILTSTAATAQQDNRRGSQHDMRANDHGQMANPRGDNNNRRADNGHRRGWGQDRGYGHRWSRGDRMGYNDWSNARRVDYRKYRLRQPPRGYEWRQQNDSFVLVARSGGLIMSVILRNGR